MGQKQAKGFWAATALLAIASVATNADADLPPPDGKKFVHYELVVENVNAFSEYVLFAYPWSASSGAPTKELRVVEDNKNIPVGRRSYPPKLYLMKKAELDKWRTEQGEKVDEAAAALVQSSSVVPCNLAPDPVFTLPTSDSRNTVIERFKLTEATSTKCSLISLTAQTTPTDSPSASAPSATAPATSGASSAKPQSSSGKDTSPETDRNGSSAGCAGCAIEDRTRAGFAGLCGALAALAVFAKRRSRNRR